MERIKQFKQSLWRYLKKTTDTKNNQIVDGWYNSYEALEKYAFNDVDKAKLHEELKARILPHLPMVKTGRIWWAASSAAAIFICGLALWSTQNKQKSTYNKYLSSTTKTGVLKYLLLTDSTEVWLNAASQFKYPETFSAESRTVYLPEGEAFFHVKRNSKRPFKVHMGNLVVTVLGTSFDINNYADLESQSIVVNTGKVSISNGTGTLAILEKGKLLTYNKKTHAYKVSEVDETLSSSWRDGKTVLKDANFLTVASVFKNWYGVVLKSEITNIHQFSYTATIERQVSLANNLELICKMHHIKYRKEGNVIKLY